MKKLQSERLFRVATILIDNIERKLGEEDGIPTNALRETLMTIDQAIVTHDKLEVLELRLKLEGKIE